MSGLCGTGGMCITFGSAIEPASAAFDLGPAGVTSWRGFVTPYEDVAKDMNSLAQLADVQRRFGEAVWRSLKPGLVPTS